MTAGKQVVLITGATSGVGRATAKLLLKQGYDVAVTGRRQERLDELINETQALTGELLAMQADVTNGEQMQQCAADVVQHFGQLDVLIANAGVGHRGAVVESAWDDIETVLDTNIKGVLHTIRAGVPYMQKQKSGHIITISSVLGPVPAPWSAIYAASKAAVDSLAQALRVELKDDNIKVSNILLGQTHTEFSEKRLGHQGRVASKLPTMQPETVAEHISKLIQRPKRTTFVRPIDRAIVVGGRFFPRVMDRILARVYGSRSNTER